MTLHGSISHSNMSLLPWYRLASKWNAGSSDPHLSHKGQLEILTVWIRVQCHVKTLVRRLMSRLLSEIKNFVSRFVFKLLIERRFLDRLKWSSECPCCLKALIFHLVMNIFRSDEETLTLFFGPKNAVQALLTVGCLKLYHFRSKKLQTPSLTKLHFCTVTTDGCSHKIAFFWGSDFFFEFATKSSFGQIMSLGYIRKSVGKVIALKYFSPFPTSKLDTYIW